jgi:hypothetical protein
MHSCLQFAKVALLLLDSRTGSIGLGQAQELLGRDALTSMINSNLLSVRPYSPLAQVGKQPCLFVVCYTRAASDQSNEHEWCWRCLPWNSGESAQGRQGTRWK